MSTGISGPEFVVLLLVAAFVLGPSRVQQLSRQLAQLIKGLRVMARQATIQARQEMGPQFEDVDWRSLDPRQYDPRRIIREAFTDTVDPDDPLGVRTASEELREAWQTGATATDWNAAEPKSKEGQPDSRLAPETEADRGNSGGQHGEHN